MVLSQYPSQDSALSGGADYLEKLYEEYLNSPEHVPASWRAYFDAFQGGLSGHQTHHQQLIEDFKLYFEQSPIKSQSGAVASSLDPTHLNQQIHVLELIQAYRLRGHEYARLDPLALHARSLVRELELKHHELHEVDLGHRFGSGSFMGCSPDATLQDIFQALQETYCGSIGVEYMHIMNTSEKEWIQSRIEPCRMKPEFSSEKKLKILKQLTAAEGIERYLHTQYVGQKRFSLEGGDSLMPCLHELVQRAGASGVKEVVLAMAHRGRLNVLVNLLGKAPQELFAEFEGKNALSHLTSGDVKYHLGFSSDVQTLGGVVHQAMAFNPSHLEIVSPVVQGSVRARQDRRSDFKGTSVVPICIHGDAAFAGQGVVMETLNMSQTRGYRTGGTVHIVINNQVGFTTSFVQDARSTLYCTDVAKMVDAPIFHVNGDDPEAVVFVTQLALDFRMCFHKDVVIDLVCYRRYGHNEADEPAATQPLMYKNIRSRPTVRASYAQALVEQGLISEPEVQAWVEAYRDQMQVGEPVLENLAADAPSMVDWTAYLEQSWEQETDTGISSSNLKKLTQSLDQEVSKVILQPQVAKIMRDRANMAQGQTPLDWGYAETLAYASLIQQGFSIRLSGQDCGRGTFAHRHAAVHDQNTGEARIPLQHLFDKQPSFTVIDSFLSEEAVLAFEYGYASASPKTLVLWEAQFGDFVNGAQVVIDQFISSGEQKWGRLCGLVMLLPHGYEGMGPEHSSARLERFLQLCAQDNMQVCVPTTPAQIFHLLRRQALRPYRKPLIVISPKSLLRHRSAVSELKDLESGHFQTILTDDLSPKKQVKKLVFCSGKVYYDLSEARSAQGLKDVAIIRMEQLYPFPEVAFKKLLSEYPKAQEYVWCQEEPKNQGAWFYIQPQMSSYLLGQDLKYAGRSESSSPAVGYHALHVQQQKELVSSALS